MISKDIQRSSEAGFGAHLQSALVRFVNEGAFANLGVSIQDSVSAALGLPISRTKGRKEDSYRTQPLGQHGDQRVF